jgi:hypothetical protein
MELKKTWGIFMFHYSVHTHKLLFIMLFIGRVFLQFGIYSFQILHFSSQTLFLSHFSFSWLKEERRAL